MQPVEMDIISKGNFSFFPVNLYSLSVCIYKGLGRCSEQDSFIPGDPLYLACFPHPIAIMFSGYFNFRVKYESVSNPWEEVHPCSLDSLTCEGMLA